MSLELRRPSASSWVGIMKVCFLIVDRKGRLEIKDPNNIKILTEGVCQADELLSVLLRDYYLVDDRSAIIRECM